MRYWPIFHAVFRIAVFRYSPNLRDAFSFFVLVDDSRHKNVSFTLAVSGRFGNNLKQPYFDTHFNLQFDFFSNRVDESVSYTGLCGIAIFAEFFFAVMRCSASPI